MERVLDADGKEAGVSRCKHTGFGRTQHAEQSDQGTCDQGRTDESTGQESKLFGRYGTTRSTTSALFFLVVRLRRIELTEIAASLLRKISIPDVRSAVESGLGGLLKYSARVT